LWVEGDVSARRGRGDQGGALGGDRGAAMVEFALILLPLAIIVFSTIDIGRAYFATNQLKNAARAAAAYAQSNPQAQKPNGSSCADPDNIQYKATHENGSTFHSDYTVTVSPSVSNGCLDPATNVQILPGTTITVTVTQPFTLVTPLASRIMGSPTIKASVSVVVQG
jgi:Flp pilus assembly protein TadG